MVQIYYNDQWNDWMIANMQSHPVYLYNKGTENSEFAGSIVASSIPIHTGSGSEKRATAITKSTNRITFKQPLTSANNYTQGSVWFSKAIDFTEYKSLNINILNLGYDQIDIYLCKSYQTERSDDIHIIRTPYNPTADDLGLKTVDISGISENFYVAFGMVGSNCQITFDKLWVE